MHRRMIFRTLGLCGLLMASLITQAFAVELDKPTLEKLRLFAEVVGKIRSDFVEPVDNEKLIDAAIRGMVTNIDPSGAYYSPTELRELTTVDGGLGGIGVELAIRAGRIIIIAPIEDAPAYRAGIKAGDYLIRVDGKEISADSLKEVGAQLRGKAGSTVEVAVERDGVSQPLVFQIDREVIRVQSVKFKLAEPDYAYARITSFREQTGEDLAKALKTMSEQNNGPFKGIILDLRNNPGGLLNAAVGVSAIFLHKGDLVVYTVGRAENAKIHLTANPENYVKDGAREDYQKGLPQEIKTVPLVVLVNRGSAAGSEIVAGALQDHKRGILMGENTFGKGKIQTILPIRDGSALKITTAQWHTPNGIEISGKGIKPDVEIPPEKSSESSQVGEQEERVYKQAIEFLKGLNEQKPH